MPRSVVTATETKIIERIAERKTELSLVRELYPNPVGVPYLGHKWW